MPVGMSARGTATCAEAVEQKPATTIPAMRNEALRIRQLLSKSTLISSPEQRLEIQFGRIAMIAAAKIHKSATLRSCAPTCSADRCRTRVLALAREVETLPNALEDVTVRDIPHAPERSASGCSRTRYSGGSSCA